MFTKYPVKAAWLAVALAAILLFAPGIVNQARADEQCTFVTSSDPDVLFILDTSGSMTFDCTRNNPRFPYNGGDNYGDCTGGDGSVNYPGLDANGNGRSDDSRMFMLKAALRITVSNMGFCNFGLMRFFQRGPSYNATTKLPSETGTWLSDLWYDVMDTIRTTPKLVVDTVKWGHVKQNYTGWTQCSWMPDWNSSYANYVSWGRFDSYKFTYDTTYKDTVVVFNPARLYWYGGGNCGQDGNILVSPETNRTAARDSVLKWIDGVETIKYTTAAAFNPELRAWGATPIARSLRTAGKYYLSRIIKDPMSKCRKYFVVLLTDGIETCSGDPVGEATDLRDIVNAGKHYDVQTYVLGVGISNPMLNNIAVAGGTDHAYAASNTQEILDALNDIFMDIRVKSFSFSSPGLSAFRGLESGYTDKLYSASFIPGVSPVWEGHFKAYDFSTGTIGPILWDAAAKLTSMSAGSRVLYTYKGGSRTLMTSVNKTDLQVADDSVAADIVDAVYGAGGVGRLADIFHSSPLLVGGGNPAYVDQGYRRFRDSVTNTRDKVVYAASNDGVMHCFSDSTGAERWGFVPPHMLPRLQLLLQQHQYYSDGPPDASDYWLPSGPTDSVKEATEWRTALTFGDQDGGRYITGLEVTNIGDSTNPANDNPSLIFEICDTLHMGMTWSTPRIYQIKKYDVAAFLPLLPRFLTFFGGGYWSDTLYYSGALGAGTYQPAKVKGNRIYAYDIYRQTLFTYSSTTDTFMKYPIPTTPTLIAQDTMAYVTSGPLYFDRMYVGDVAGQLWKVWIKPDMTTWTVKRLFTADSTGKPDSSKPFFFAPRLRYDYQSKIWWVYAGTGDRAKPCKRNAPGGKSSTRDRFYAIKDDDNIAGALITETNLKKVSPLGSTPLSSAEPYKGWYIKYSDYDSAGAGRAGEKTFCTPTILHFPVGNVDSLYFNTFQPESTSACTTGSGKARMYRIDAYSGGTNRAGEFIGYGIPTSPQVSVGVDGKAVLVVGVSETGTPVIVDLPDMSPKKIIKWKEIK